VKRVIIHIGVHKTGTTSLQKAFATERALLREHGIAYPLLPGQAQAGQHALAYAVRRRDVPAVTAMLRAADVAREGLSTVLFSSEDLSNAPADGIAVLKDLLDQQFGRPDFTIYVGIRRWADRLISFWQHFTRHGSPVAMPTFVETQLAMEAEGHRLDIAPAINRWTDVFGQQSVIVSPVERATARGNDLVVHVFRELLGIDAPALAGRYAENTSVIEHTELVRAVNILRSGVEPHDNRAVARCVVRCIELRKTKALLAASLIAPRLESLVLSDDHPLFRKLEHRSGCRFPAREARAWRHAPNALFEDRTIAPLIAAVHRKALRLLERKRSARQSRQQPSAMPPP
jgi:hypothetical protein